MALHNNTMRSTGNQELDRLVQKAELPTLPVVAQKLIELCKDEDATFAHFARVIESDPGLASRILKVANSAYYGLRNKVSSLERGITVLGLKYVKSVSLGFHLARALSKLGGTGFNMHEFWRQSLLRGCIARQLANRYCPSVCEEAFLVGLLQDCGIPVLARALGKDYASLWNQKDYSQGSLFRMEREVFQIDHLVIAGAIARQWSLPEILARSIRTHHGRGNTKPSLDEKIQLCQIGYFVGTLSMNNPEMIGQHDLDLPQYCHTVFGLDIKSIDTLFEESRERFNSIAKMFAGIIPEQVDVIDLLAQSKELLSNLAVGSMQDLFDLGKEVLHFQQQCQNLVIEVDEYMKQAQRNESTGLFLGDVLEIYLDSACKKDENRKTSLLVMYLTFNEPDETESSESDSLMQNLAELLKKIFGNSGCVCYCRQNTLAVALMGLRQHQAVQLAEGLMTKIHELNAPLSPEEEGDESVTDSEHNCIVQMMFFREGTQPKNGREVIELLNHSSMELVQKGKYGLHVQVGVC